MNVDPLGDRMKTYEVAARTVLPRRLPVILRVDGKAFHTLTRRCEKPFDWGFIRAMNEVAIALCEEIQGAQLAYVQSDEVSVLVHGYKRYASQPWFGNEVQKMVSVAASVATAAFNKKWLGDRAHFDARVFVLPEADVCNSFIWRQQDAARNSIQMLARAHFSQKECHGLSCGELMGKLVGEKGVRWEDLPMGLRFGRVAKRFVREDAERPVWAIDGERPLFTADRAYIEKHLELEPEDGAEEALR